jgi:septum formation protein
MILQKRPLILASKSPRRKQLLEEAGFEFSIQTLDTDETWPDDLPNEKVAKFLAIKKAQAASIFIENDAILLSADTTVLLNGEILNKPIDRADAFRMIKELSGKMHRVITGVCLLAKEKTVAFSVVSSVFMADITSEEIDYYIDRCQPFDKAGAYGVQEWIGHCKIERIEGTYANVMGLPVHAIYAALKDF